MQAWGPEFDLQNPYFLLKPGMMFYIRDPSARELETGEYPSRLMELMYTKPQKNTPFQN